MPEELFEIVERVRPIEHGTRSEVVQEALRAHSGEAVYVPREEERRLLLVTLDQVEQAPDRIHGWDEVRSRLRAGL